MTDKVKAKRKLTDISFEKEGAHLALVHKVQGGAASGYSTLVMKATDKYSEEFIQKASQVKVTLSLPDFLEKFFHVWGDDAEILANLFGYTPSEETEDEYERESFWCWYREKAAEAGNLDYWGDPITRATDADKQEWLQEQLKGIEILKSATLAKGTADFIASLTEEQYLNLLKDQEFIEKSFTKKEDVKEQNKEQPKQDTDLTKSKSGGKPNNKQAITADTKGNKMETIEKAQYDAQQVELQKALADIQKAKEEIELFKAKEKASIEKARETTLKAAVQEDEASAKLFKAIKDLDEAAFTDVVDVVKSLVAKLDQADLFKEQGSPETNAKVTKSADPVANALLARLTKQTQQ
jgi:hypothetical protein